MTQLLALHDNIIVVPLEESEQLHGNILIPDLGRERPEIGKVVAVGPGRTTEFGSFLKPSVEVGDTVLIPKIGFIRVDFDGIEYFIGPFREILCIVK
jgi:chaperonin GroES